MGLLQLLPPLPASNLLATDFLHSIWVALLFLSIRLASEYLLTPPLAKGLKWIKKGAEVQARRVYDEFFIAASSGALEVLAIIVLMNYNYGCRPWRTDPCLVGWPGHEVNDLQRWYFIATAGYNLYEFMSTALGVGTILKLEMMIHHALTVLLVVSAYMTNLIRYGSMWMALFDLSNPLLHGAKILNAIDAESLSGLKWVVFLCFASVFFIGRVVATPFSVLRPAIFQSFDIVPFSYSVSFIALMLIVYALQCFWFYKIVLIGITGGKSSNKGEKVE